MKIASKKTNKLPIVIITIIVATVLVGSVAFAVYSNRNSENNDPQSNSQKTEVNLDQPTDQQTNSGTDIKQQNVEDEATTNTPASTLSVSMNIYAKNNTTTHVTVDIQNLISSGTCTLTVSNESISKSYTAEVQPLAQYSTCKGFDIPNAEIGAGNWSATVSVKSNEGIAGNATGSIVVN